MILIKAVSKNNQMIGETAFSTEWVGNNLILFDTEKCMRYVQKSF